MTNTFVLSPESDIRIESVGLDIPRWNPPSHLGRIRPALTLLAGEKICIPFVDIGEDSVLSLSYAAGLPRISADGMSLRVREGDTTLVEIAIRGGDAQGLCEMTIGLGHLAGRSARLEIEAGPGPENDPTADWASLIELVVGPAHAVPLLRARAFREVRIANELAHFAAVYDNALRRARPAGAVVRRCDRCRPTGAPGSAAGPGR